MWIEKATNGFRLYDRYKGTDGKLHKVSVPLDRNTAQARRVAQAELQKKIMNKSSEKSKTGLFWLIERYLDQKDVKATTLTSYKSLFGQVQEILGDVDISELTVPYIKRSLANSGKSAKTMNRYLGVFRDFLSWAVEYGYLEEYPVIKNFPDKSPKRDSSQEYLEASELQAVLDQVVGTMHYYVIKFLALTGCRVGEMTALTMSDIDDKYIHITKGYHAFQGISTPKTESSQRDIFIQPELADMLKEYKEWRNLYMMAKGIRTDKLFFTKKGTWMQETLLYDKLAKLDCPKHLHPHIFRHTHVALLAEQGLSLETISRRLGHKTSNVTKEVYFHVTEKLKNRDEEAISKISILRVSAL